MTAATKAEGERDEYEDLGPQIINDPLTEEAFVRALQKLKRIKHAVRMESLERCFATVRQWHASYIIF